MMFLDLEFNCQDEKGWTDVMQDQIFRKQMFAKAGDEKIGEKAVLAIVEEFAQFRLT